MLDFDRDVSIGDAKAGPVLNATSPDLRSFRASGGAHSLSRLGRRRDPGAEFDRILRQRARLSLEVPGRADARRSADGDFYRLFLVPGMAHCGGGAARTASAPVAVPHQAPILSDIFTALERWVSSGVAPERMIGTGRASEILRSRSPGRCAHIRRWRSTRLGRANDASNFACTAPASR
jgi:feruloyl esterase